MWLAPAVFSVFVAFGASACAPTPQAQTAPRPSSDDDRVAGEYILALKPDSDAGRVRASLAPLAVAELRPLGGRHYLLRLENDPGLAAVRAAASRVEAIESVEPNFRYRPQ